MPNQSFNLNIKANDMGWQGKQVQLFTCAECGTDSSGASSHSSWHDGLTQALQQLQQAIQQEAQARQQADQAEQTRATGAEAALSARLSAHGF